MKERLDAWNTAASLGYKISAVIGAIVVFAYLFQIKFFPTGLTTAEVIFFIFVAMGFGIVYLAILGFGILSAVWLVNFLLFFRNKMIFKRENESKEGAARSIPENILCKWIYQKKFSITRKSRRGEFSNYWSLSGFQYTLVSFFLFLILLVFLILAETSALKRLFGGIFVAGFFVISTFEANLWGMSGRPAKNSYHTPALFRVAFVLIFPLFVISEGMTLVHVVFQQLGIRILNVSVEIPSSERDSVERISEALHRPILDCRRSSKEGRLMLHQANVLWTGIGNTTYLSFDKSRTVPSKWLGADTEKLKQVALRLDTSSIRIIDAKPQLSSCYDLPNDELFETAKYDITPEAKNRLIALVSLIKDGNPKALVVVRGHSDARPVGAQMARDIGDNQKLSELRAHAVAAEIKKLLGTSNIDIKSEGVGSREPKVNCPVGSGTTPYEAQQCNASNRRVEIRVNNK